MTKIDGAIKAIDGGNQCGPSPPVETGGCRCTPPFSRRRVAGAEAAGSIREVMSIEVVRGEVAPIEVAQVGWQRSRWCGWCGGDRGGAGGAAAIEVVRVVRKRSRWCGWCGIDRGGAKDHRRNKR